MIGSIAHIGRSHRGRSAVAVVILSLMVGACGSAVDRSASTSSTPATTAAAPTTTALPTTVPPTPTTTIPTTTTTMPPAPWPDVPEWVEPVVTYLEAYRSAVNSGDVHEVFPFLADGVVWWEPGGRLRSGLLDTLTGLQEWSPPQRRPGTILMTWGPADGGIGYLIDWVHEAERPPAECDGAEPCHRIEDLRLTVGPEGVLAHRSAPLVAAAAGVDATVLERIEDRYADIAERLSSGDAEVAGAMFSDAPIWVDGGDGNLTQVNPRKRWEEGIAAVFAELPEAGLATLTTADLGFDGAPRPAVFYLPAEARGWYDDDTIAAVGVYRQTVMPGVTVLMAFEWVEQPDGIIALDTSIEPIGLANWTESGDPVPMADDPTLWPQVPPPSRELTGTMEAEGGEILFYNGSESLQGLVEWALGRYVAAGLAAPMPRSIAFPPSVNCVLYAGLAVDTGEGVDVQLCFDESEVCTGDDCIPSTTAKSTMLHELGHVWTIQNVDGATREEFLEVRDLDVWSAPGVGRDELGTEHAAEILAWALLEDDTWPARLPNSECAALAAGYRVLTGREPPRGCPAG